MTYYKIITCNGPILNDVLSELENKVNEMIITYIDKNEDEYYSPEGSPTIIFCEGNYHVVQSMKNLCKY